MNAVQAAAMWLEANILLFSAEITLRHLRLAFGYHTVVPRPLLLEIGNITEYMKPVYGTYNHYVDKDNEIGVSEIAKTNLSWCHTEQLTGVK